jgi:hypothetical protein
MGGDKEEASGESEASRFNVRLARCHVGGNYPLRLLDTTP